MASDATGNQFANLTIKRWTIYRLRHWAKTVPLMKLIKTLLPAWNSTVYPELNWPHLHSSLRFPPNSSFSQLTSNNVLLAVCILLLFQNSSLSPIQLTNSDLHYSVVCVNIISCSPNYNWLLQIEATNSSQLRNIDLLQNFVIFLDFISVIVLEICINNS